MATSHAQMISDEMARATGRTPARVLPAHVVASWRRCVEEYGLLPDRVHLPQVLTPSERLQLCAPIDDLIAMAKPELERLFLRLRDYGFIVSLAERGGAIVHFRGGAPLPDAFANTRNVLGAISCEERQGTGGIGTCLREARPLIVDRDEHFDSRVIGFTCVAAPVMGAGGEVAAVLNASSWQLADRVAPGLVLDIVNQSARRITNRLFARRQADRRVLRISRFSDFADVSAEGRIAVDASDRIVDATAEALQLIGAGETPPLGMRIRDLRAILCGEGDIPRAPARGRLFMRMLDVPRRQGSASRMRGRTVDDRPLGLADIQGLDPGLEAQLARARRVLGRGVPILILGETGCGKAALARALHDENTDLTGPFLGLICAALSADRLAAEIHGLLEACDGSTGERAAGTLFLDEIDALPLDAQVGLLGLLTLDAPISTTAGGRCSWSGAVIAASRRDLAALVRTGGFREDLHHRIAGLTLQLPPLRERRDLELLIDCMFRDEARRAGVPTARIDAAALRALRMHGWPGNFHELRHAARIAITLAEGGDVTLAALPPPFHSSAPWMPSARVACRRDDVQSALDRTRWNVRRAALLLGVSRATLHRRIKTLGLHRDGRGMKRAWRGP